MAGGTFPCHTAQPTSLLKKYSPPPPLFLGAAPSVRNLHSTSKTWEFQNTMRLRWCRAEPRDVAWAAPLLVPALGSWFGTSKASVLLSSTGNNSHKSKHKIYPCTLSTRLGGTLHGAVSQAIYFLHLFWMCFSSAWSPSSCLTPAL